MYYLYAKNNIWNAFVYGYLCCLEQQLIIYSTFLNLFFSLYQWTFSGKNCCDESLRSWGLIHLVFNWCLSFKHTATAEPLSPAAEIVLNVLFPGLFGFLLHVAASLVHPFCHQITHHSRRWTLTTPTPRIKTQQPQGLQNQTRNVTWFRERLRLWKKIFSW